MFVAATFREVKCATVKNRDTASDMEGKKISERRTSASLKF